MDEVLLITGSSGIAAAVARMWATENSVFVFGVNERECQSLADELHAAAMVRLPTPRLTRVCPCRIGSGELMRS